jgi:hypothetical protein
MVKVLYCWRCDADIPMLEEHEWEQIQPYLKDGLRKVGNLVRNHSMSVQEAKDEVYGRGALERYFQFTGYRETNINALWHHRVSQYGPPCKVCGKPLRKPKAKMCTACGTPA